MQTIFETEVMTRSAKNTQIFLALPTGMLGAYVIINIMNAAFGSKLFLKAFLPFGFVLFVAGIIGIIVVWYRNKGVLRVSRSSDNGLQIEIEFPSGTEELAKGQWAAEGIYTKVYEKLGMYKKHLALNLSCDQRPFCLLREDLAPIKSEPQHFTMVNELYNLGGTEYWCKNTEGLHELIRKENSVKN